MSAFKHLEKNHHICIEDYSSRVVKKMESYNSYDLVQEAIASLRSLLVQWDLAMGKFEKFSFSVHDSEFSDNFRGQRTPRGMVYGLLCDYLTSVRCTLRDKTKDIRSGMDEVELDRRSYQRRLAEKGRLFLRIVSPAIYNIL